MKASGPRAAPAPQLRRRPARSLRRHRPERHGVPPAAGGTGGRQFTGIVGTSSTVITAEDIAHSPSQTLPEIIAQVPGVQLQSLLWRRQRRQDRRSTCAALARSPPPIPWSCVNGRRLNDIDMAGVDLSTIPLQFDRAHRDHPRQQRRGALRRQRGRRRHQHRHQDRRRRPAGRDPRPRPASARSTSAWPRSRPRPIPDRGRRRSTATASSPTAIATTTRSTSATASAISTTPRPTSRRS